VPAEALAKAGCIEGLVLLFLLLKLWNRMGVFKALGLSLFFTIGSFIIFFGLAWGILVWGLGVSYTLPEDAYQGSYNNLNASLILAAFYIGIQLLLLLVIKKWAHLSLWRVFLCILCSNIMSALLVYKLTFNM
jgi:hypothetical protein